MRILVALPIEHPAIPSLDDAISDRRPLSGTTGSFIRVADLLSRAGLEVSVALKGPSQSSTILRSVVSHDDVTPGDYDRIIAHQTHWNGNKLSFGNGCLPKVALWLQNQASYRDVSAFLNASGRSVICPSTYHADLYRAASGWAERVWVIRNLLPMTFHDIPLEQCPAKRQLLFVGAITPSKGFVEVMEVWNHLSASRADLSLVIAGGIDLHSGQLQTGPLGIADKDFEHGTILPWLSALPASHKPSFAGSLNPQQLRDEIIRSWAGLVNPAKDHPETFCVAAAEIQACSRTVFSVAAGALPETVFTDFFDSLEPSDKPQLLAERICRGLEQTERVQKNGAGAAGFIRKYCSSETIAGHWTRLIDGQAPTRPRSALSGRNLLADALRRSHSGDLANRLVNAVRTRRAFLKNGPA